MLRRQDRAESRPGLDAIHPGTLQTGPGPKLGLEALKGSPAPVSGRGGGSWGQAPWPAAQGLLSMVWLDVSGSRLDPGRLSQPFFCLSCRFRQSCQTGRQSRAPPADEIPRNSPGSPRLPRACGSRTLQARESGRSQAKLVRICLNRGSTFYPTSRGQVAGRTSRPRPGRIGIARGPAGLDARHRHP